MSDTNYRVEPDRITIHPQWGTGWSTVLDQTRQEMTMQPCILGLKLPLRRRVPYAQIGRISSVCRETWWSRIWLAHGIGNPEELSPMPNKGWVYDLLLTVKGSRKPIEIGTVKSPNTASNLVEECRRRLGLSET
jgi:hypothetical protein